jgi:hypothetical protein
VYGILPQGALKSSKMKEISGPPIHLGAWMDSSITFLSGRKWSESPVLYAPTRIPTWWGRPTKMASLRSVTTGGVSVQDLVHSTWNLPSKFKSDSHKWIIANHTWLV